MAGTIALRDSLRIQNPFVTIAGQSAPGTSITLRMRWATPGYSATRQHAIGIYTNDVIIRHLRVRPGPACEAAIFELPAGAAPYFPTCVLFGSDGVTIFEEAHDVIIDHLSLSWATDEALSTFDDPGTPGLIGPSDVTIQNSIISEVLRKSVHNELVQHSRAALFNGGRRISFHHNYLSYNRQRNPQLSNVGEIEIVSNLVYGFDWAAARIYGFGVQPSEIDFRHNYYHQGDHAGSTHISARRFDRLHDITANPHMLFWVVDQTGFTTAPFAPTPEFSFFGEGNRFFNYPNFDVGNGGFDADADVPICWDALAAPANGALTLTNPYCSVDLNDDPYSDLATASVQHAQGQDHPILETPAESLGVLFANVGASRPARDSTDLRVLALATADPASAVIETDPAVGGGDFVDTPPLDHPLDDCPQIDPAYAGFGCPWPPPFAGAADADIDEDGMADSWEVQHGLVVGIRDHNDDPDGDVYTNLEEFLNDTDPGASVNVPSLLGSWRVMLILMLAATCGALGWLGRRSPRGGIDA